MSRATLALIVKELRVLLKSPRGFLALLVPPVFQLLLYGYAATFDVTRVPIAVMNEDQGAQGRELAARFAGAPMFEIAALPVREAEIAPLIDRGDVVMVLRIGQRFSADLGASRPAGVQIIIDGRPLNTALAVQGYATQVVAAFNRDYIATNGLGGLPALTVTRAWFNPNLLSHWYVIPGLVAKVLLIVTLTTMALAVARERERGTYERLLMTPLTPAQLVLGKTVPALAIGMVQGLVLSALTILWFEVPFRGTLALLALSLAAMLLSAIGIGLLISAIARTQPQAILGTFVFMVPAIMLSGFATPIASMPEPIQLLTLVNPIRYFIVITRGLFLRASGWDFVWPQLWPMLLIAAATLAATCFLLRRRLD
jgi:ABC-2 type transport system permease protein